MNSMNIQELYEAGYRVGRPHWGLIDGASIDEEVCTESTCEDCGHKGMEYHPFVREEPRSYRTYAKCPECGASFEF